MLGMNVVFNLNLKVLLPYNPAWIFQSTICFPFTHFCCSQFFSYYKSHVVYPETQENLDNKQALWGKMEILEMLSSQ